VSALRRRPNFNVVPLGADAGRELLRAVRRGEIVVLASDRDLAGQSMVLPFFGEPAAVPAGPAVLASRGIPLITAAAARIEGRFSIGRIDPPIEAAGQPPEAIMGEIIGRLEDFIGRYPENWSVLQPVWNDEGVGRSA
jgi:lauroyl/myristoyl acyltransferase